MLKILEGGFSSAAHIKITELIRERVDAKERAFLIVPEQQTVTAEKEMTDLLPPCAPRYFEVTNFTRFTNTAFRALGGVAGEYSSKGKNALIMWRTLTELAPFLSVTAHDREINSGLVEKMLSAVKEMQSFGIRPEELGDASIREELRCEERLSRKVSDLSRVATLYKKLLSEKYSDAEDDLYALIKKLGESKEFTAGCSFFIEGFTSFTEPQLLLIAKLMEGADVTVHLCITKARADSFEFTEIKGTKERLLMLADKSYSRKQIIKIEEKDLGKPSALAEAEKLLWHTHGKLTDADGISEALRIFEASDPYDECDAVASDIKRRVMAGANYRDFAIIARGIDEYAGIIDASLSRAEIPHFMAKKRDASSFEAVKLIYSALGAVRSGFAREDVIAYAKCGMCGISMDECDEFEIYTEKWQITKRRFTDGVLWNMSPDGYGARKRDGDAERLERINAVREKILSPLIRLSDSLDAARTVREHACALVEFMLDINLEGEISRKADELFMLGEKNAAEENRGLWKIICSALDDMVEVLEDSEINRTGFENQLKVIISLADIGRIPSYFDEVTLGSADMIRLSGKKHVYMIGVNQGKFPKTPKETSYFSDREKDMLSSLGLAVVNESETRYSRELFFFSRVFSSAEESVTLSYPIRSRDLSVLLPADVIGRICEITDGKAKPIKTAELAPNVRIYTPEGLMEYPESLENPDVRELLCECGYSNALSVSERDITNKEMTLSVSSRGILYPEDIPLTQSRIDAYLNCPFAYFLKYDLKLSENERAEFDNRSIGSFIHAVLENFFKEIGKNDTSISSMSEEKKDLLIKSSAEKYLCDIGDIHTKRNEILIGRLVSATRPIIDGLADELCGSLYTPKFFELPISRAGGENPFPAVFGADKDRKIYVYGSIDRVDTYKHGKDVYVRVIDYKTGSKDFSASDIDEGRNLQMFLYLKSIVESENSPFLQKIGLDEGGKLIPAGVIYVKADIGDTSIMHDSKDEEMKAAKKKQTRRGMILDAPESLNAMNKDFLPVKFKKDGSPDARTADNLYTLDGWKELNEKMKVSVEAVARDMTSGKISAKPDKEYRPCDYCSFAPVCRNKK